VQLAGVAGVRDTRIGPGIMAVSSRWWLPSCTPDDESGCYGRVRDSCISAEVAASALMEAAWLAGRLAKRPGWTPGRASPVDMAVFPGREIAKDPVAISPGVRATSASIGRVRYVMGISGWDAVPGDTERRLIGELARVIGSVAVSGGTGRPCLTTAQPWSSIAGVTLLEGFIPVFLTAELDLHLRGERVGRAAA